MVYGSKRRGPMLIAPAIIVLLLVNIIPLMWSFGLSFFKYRANTLKLPKFSWFYSYEKVLTKDNIWEVSTNYCNYCSWKCLVFK